MTMKTNLFATATCLFALSLSANTQARDNLSFSLGASTFALAQNISDGFTETDLTFTGLQLVGAMSVSDNVQAQLSIYGASEADYDDLTVSGNSIRMNFGKGFQLKGFKAYATVGYFNESLEDATSESDGISGFEFGGAIGYNFDAVSLDYGITIRNSDGYAKDGVWGEGLDVTTATGFLALTGNF